jgi:hypothetical protein
LAYKQNRLLIVQSLKDNPLSNLRKTSEIKNLFESLLKTRTNKKSSQAIRFVLSEQEYKNFGEILKKASANVSKTAVICENELNLTNFAKPVIFIFTIDAFLNLRCKFI